MVVLVLGFVVLVLAEQVASRGVRHVVSVLAVFLTRGCSPPRRPLRRANRTWPGAYVVTFELLSASESRQIVRARRLLPAALVVVAALSGALASAVGHASPPLSLRCQGVSVRVPAGWHGRIRRGEGGYFTLTLATFALVPEADAVDEQSARRMRAGDVLVLLIAYGASEASNPTFQTHTRLPLRVEVMRVYRQFEHLPHDHRLARRSFMARGGTYDAQVQFARTITTRLRQRADSALRLVHFSAPPGRSPSGQTRC